MRLNIYKATLNDERQILYARADTVKRTVGGDTVDRKGLKVTSSECHAYYFTSGISASLRAACHSILSSFELSPLISHLIYHKPGLDHSFRELLSTL